MAPKKNVSGPAHTKLQSLEERLRTELNTVLGFTQLLHDDVNLSANKEYSKQVLESGWQLLTVTEEIIELMHRECLQKNMLS